MRILNKDEIVRRFDPARALELIEAGSLPMHAGTCNCHRYRISALTRATVTAV